MKKQIFKGLFVMTVLSVGLWACTKDVDNTTDTTIELVSPETLAKDSKFNGIIMGLNDIQARFKSQKSSLKNKEEKEAFSSKLQFLASKALSKSLAEADLKDWSNMLGYSEYQSILHFDGEQKKRVDELLILYPALNEINDTKKKLLFEKAFILVNKNLSAQIPAQLTVRIPNPDDTCREQYFICSSVAFGGYMVALTGPCQGAWILGPAGFTACAAGASLVYTGALYTCWNKFCS